MHLRKERAECCELIVTDVGLFIGEIELRFDPRQGFEQPAAPARAGAPEHALALPQRLAKLGAGGGGDDVGHRFGGREIELAVEKGATGELARTRGAQSRQIRQSVGQGARHRGTAVVVQLDHVFAGIAARSRKPEHEALVDRLAAARIAQDPKRRPPLRRRRFTG